MKIRLAKGILMRARGLLFRKQDWLHSDEALLFVPCKSIHTIGMRYEIDVAFFDEKGRVLKVKRKVGSCKIVRCKQASFVLERPFQTGSWVLPNTRLELKM